MTNCWTDWGPKCAVISCKHLIKGLRDTLEQGSTCCKKFGIVLQIQDFSWFTHLLNFFFWEFKGKVAYIPPVFEEWEFPLVQLWMWDSFLSSRVGRKAFSLRNLVQIWTKDSFVSSRVGRKTVSCRPTVDKFLEQIEFMFVFGQSFWSEYYSVNEFR